jgi:hypothetical protein
MVGVRYRIPIPLEIEWQPGATTIGDFVWPGGARVGVKASVFAKLRDAFSALGSCPIEMVQDPKLRRGRGSKPRVWLPYDGPALVELIVQRRVAALPATTTTDGVRCDVCGQAEPDLVGVEEKHHRWNPAKKRLVPIHVPREEKKGLFVRHADLLGDQFFRVDWPFSALLMCTDEAKSRIETLGFTNIDFLLYGEAV